MIMKNLLCCLMIVYSCLVFTESSIAQQQIPLGGNTFTNADESGRELITEEGILPWAGTSTHFDTYIRVSHTGSMAFSVLASAEYRSVVQVNLMGKNVRIVIDGDSAKWYSIGTWEIRDTGYLKIRLSGISTSGAVFPRISRYAVRGTAIDANTRYVPNNEGNFFYWGRRGPSVHLNYLVADSIAVSWLYNELTVPAGEDKIGSYFMADGFAEGYFGIQVNSETERRILFSVWSPFETDDPKSIPDSLRIRLTDKGKDVVTGEFGNEGAGGQSFLRYPWKSGHTYRFLLGARDLGHHHTQYSAYFFAPETGHWQLIASFDRPQAPSTLHRLHSFLENFIPQTGDQERRVLFGNQWICTASGQWLEITKAVFSADNTARKGYRMDFYGNLNGNRFELKNCGFFDLYQSIGKILERPAQHQFPCEADKFVSALRSSD